MQVACIRCGASGALRGRNPEEYAYFTRDRSDAWAFHGAAELNAPETYRYLTFIKKGKPVRLLNPSFNPAKEPHVVKLWLCPPCENEIQANLFSGLVGLAKSQRRV
jgi:hypothetical protein